MAELTTEQKAKLFDILTSNLNSNIDFAILVKTKGAKLHNWPCADGWCELSFDKELITWLGAKCDGNHAGPACADPHCWIK